MNIRINDKIDFKALERYTESLVYLQTGSVFGPSSYDFHDRIACDGREL